MCLHSWIAADRNVRAPCQIRSCLALPEIKLFYHALGEPVPIIRRTLWHGGGLQKLVEIGVFHGALSVGLIPFNQRLSFPRAANNRQETVVSDQPSTLVASAWVGTSYVVRMMP